MFELFLAARFAGSLEQKGRRRPIDDAEASPVQEVDDHRDGGCEKPPEDRL